MMQTGSLSLAAAWLWAQFNRKEMADANAKGEDWHNAVGSGPFILTDYASGVGATYTKNPNYWGTTDH